MPSARRCASATTGRSSVPTRSEGVFDSLPVACHRLATFQSRPPSSAGSRPDGRRDMTTKLTRRSVLRGAGLLGAAVATGVGAGRARAAQTVKFAGWTFKPETVQDYVTMYNQKYAADVKYETVPWPQYHPSLETRAFGGDTVDVMYCTHNNRERW